jgi:opacity protein-like surface antigen
MKKYLSIYIGAFLLFSQQLSAGDPSTQIYASDIEIEDSEQYGFVGIGGGYLNLTRESGSEYVYFSNDKDESKGVIDIRAGLQTNVWRTMFTYESNFDSYQAFLIEADRTIIAGLLGGKGRIYLGASGGWIEFYGERLLNNALVDFEDYGYVYGGNLGFMYYLSDQVDMSLEYRYLFTSSSCTLKDIQGVNLALHYFF